jgi:hypothetical protein
VFPLFDIQMFVGEIENLELLEYEWALKDVKMRIIEKYSK